MARGGKREGAGRKPSEATVRSRVIADKMAKEGIMPLEILVTVMREEWEAFRAAELKKDAEAVKGHRARAVEMANDAAPYLHPKLAPVDAKTGEVARFVIIDPTQ